MAQDEITGTLAKFYDEIQEWDFCVRTDLDEDTNSVCYLATVSDPSVGIFEHVLSPYFQTTEELSFYWWDAKRDILKEAYGEDYETT